MHGSTESISLALREDNVCSPESRGIPPSCYMETALGSVASNMQIRTTRQSRHRHGKKEKRAARFRARECAVNKLSALCKYAVPRLASAEECSTQTPAEGNPDVWKRCWERRADETRRDDRREISTLISDSRKWRFHARARKHETVAVKKDKSPLRIRYVMHVPSTSRDPHA